MNIAISIIGIIVCLVIVYLVNKHFPDNGCNQDCNQGRNCNCGDK